MGGDFENGKCEQDKMVQPNRRHYYQKMDMVSPSPACLPCRPRAILSCPSRPFSIRKLGATQRDLGDRGGHLVLNEKEAAQ